MSASVRRVPEGEIPTVVILDAALEAFAEHGYDATSVREVARSLGASHNLIPNRIGSKDELWRAAIDHGAQQLYEALETTFTEETPQTDTASLEALVARFVEAHIARPALVKVMAQESMVDGPRLAYLFDRWIEPVLAFSTDLLAGLREADEVIVDSVGLVYFFMAFGGGGPAAFPALAARFGSSVDASDPVAVREYATTAARVLFNGMVTRPGT